LRARTGLCWLVLILHCIVAHTGAAQLRRPAWGQCIVRLVENDGTQSSFSFSADSAWQHVSIPLSKFGSGSEFLNSPVSTIILVPTGTGTYGSRIAETAEWFDQITLGTRVIDDFEDGDYSDWALTMATNGSYLRMQATPHGPDSSLRCFNIVFGCGLEGSFIGWLTKSLPGVSLTANDTLSFWLRGVTYVLNDAQDDHSPVPSSLVLYQNFPNPFNPTTTINFSLPSQSLNDAEGRAGYITTLTVYDLLGREMAVLVDGRLNPGVHNVQFDGSGLASGTYVCRLTGGGQTAVRKMTLLR
jgi:hypothetical protein